MLGTLKKIKILLNRYWESANKLVKKIIIYVSPFLVEESGENLDFFSSISSINFVNFFGLIFAP